ncbi:sulfurtransferase complex subunit TusC [Microbulbifer bruguierae]|uniref:Sulfurtransferase complex subunit TusC n=1 Tax=Microbulbifer bruguierae TaxID=3029061 RepID=A0ABY8NDV8_9GAMM|nr:sulfurtransferase complex subunit TusC [Microbulbifer bruguierae]WGL16993.1 sulfurtransferase complex subunit TusC [Microbulbifer bruguierae]
MVDSKSLLALCRHAPYGNSMAREGLEAVLACAAMDQTPEVLFINDGVFQLMEQNPVAIGEKNLRRNLQALPIFGVETLFVCENSLRTRGLKPEQLEIPGAEVKLVKDTGAFIAGFDQVLSF